MSASTTEPTSGKRAGLMPDIWGGLAAMLVALPSSIAFGVLVFSAISPAMAGAGALAGMTGAAALGLIAPFSGRTKALISAPCAPAAAILSGLAATLVAAGIAQERIPALLGLTVLLAAVLQLVYGLVRAGRLIKYIPYPVVSGYLSGVGLIIALGQLPKFLGLPSGIHLFDGLLAPELWQWQGILVGLATMVLMLFAPRLTTRVPAPIIGLSGGIVGYFLLAVFDSMLLSLDANTLVIGEIRASGSLFGVVSARLTSLAELDMGDIVLVAYSALTLSVLLSIDTLKTCVVLDAMTQNRHNSNQELFGQGLANLGAFFAGGLAGAGTMGPTLVNISSGGHTTRSSIAEGCFVVLAIVLLSPLIAWVPIAALAAVLLLVAWRMIDWGAFKLLKQRETRLDFIVMAAVVVVAETVGLIAASAIGVGLAILLFIRDQIRSPVLRRSASLEVMSSKTRRLQAERDILRQQGALAGVYELQGNLFFGTTDQLFTELETDLRQRLWMLFDLRRVQSIDFTAARLFTQMHARLRARGGGLLFSGFPSRLPTRQDIQRYLRSAGSLGDQEGSIRIFAMRNDALEWMESALLKSAGWQETNNETLLESNEIELFREMGEKELESLKHCIQQRHVPAGAHIFQYQDAGDELYLIRKGSVSILLPLPGGKLHYLASFGQGDFFGEMAFLDKEPRSAHAMARTDCDLFVLSRAEFNKQSRLDPVLGTQVFARLAKASAQRLRIADSELRILEDR